MAILLKSFRNNVRALIIVFVSCVACQCGAQHKTENRIKQPNRAESDRLMKSAGQLPQGGKHWTDTVSAAIAADTTNAAAYKERSVFFTKSGDYQQARFWLDRAVEKDPQELAYRGWLNLYKMRNYKQAIADLEKFHELTKNEYAWGENIYFLIGLAKRQQHNFPGAISYFTRYIDAETKLRGESWVDVYAFLYRGICEKALKRYSEALTDFDRSIRYYTSCSDAYYQKGLVLAAQSERDQSCRNLTEARALALQGYLRSDAYKELFDQIFLADIERALEEQNCRK